LPLYEYECKKCGYVFDEIEKLSSLPWEIVIKKPVYCSVCKRKSAFRIPSRFKLGTKVLETTGKSGYETDDLTLGKLIDEGGIPPEEKRRLRKREKMIERQKKYTRELNRRAKEYNFDPYS